jgi:hypothetical protein
MPLAGLVINRVHRTAPVSGTPPLSAARAAAAADALATKASADAQLAALALRVHAETAALAENDARMAKRFCAAHPAVPVVVLPALAADVHDIDALQEIGELLVGSPITP